MEQEKLCIAQCLHQHPVMEEKDLYKMKYINVLEYFTELYSSEDAFAKGMLQVYKNKFITSTEYQYSEIEIKGAFKKATQYKLKGFKLFTYRYNLLFDCFFINAFNEPKKAAEIADKIKTIFKPRYYAKIDRLYDLLYNGGENTEFIELSRQIECWELNRSFQAKKLNRVIITANMSAGKSTLINALIGKKINRTQNDACTAKIHYIYNKPYEDGLSYEFDYEMNLNASMKELMEDNSKNKDSDISVGTYFRSIQDIQNKMCIIDTPGVNSALDKEHKQLTEQVILEKNYDKLVFVLNAENIGTVDDRLHLSFVCENVKDKPIIFVINKLDTYDKSEDSITEKIFAVKKELQEIGFNNPIICPVSAQAAMLVKKKMWNEAMAEDELFTYEMYKRRFTDKSYNLSLYSDVEDTSNLANEDEVLLHNIGYMTLEKIIIK
jgi:small GTP-binding protein